MFTEINERKIEKVNVEQAKQYLLRGHLILFFVKNGNGYFKLDNNQLIMNVKFRFKKPKILITNLENFEEIAKEIYDYSGLCVYQGLTEEDLNAKCFKDIAL